MLAEEIFIIMALFCTFENSPQSAHFYLQSATLRMGIFSLLSTFVVFFHVILAVNVSITPVNHTGTGCPYPRSLLYTDLVPYPRSLSPTDLTAIQHVITGLTPTWDPSSSRRQECTIHLKVEFSEPCYWLYFNTWGMDANFSTTVPANTSLTFQSRYQFVDEGVPQMGAGNDLILNGPFDGKYSRRLDEAEDNMLRGPCGGGILQILYRTRLRLNGAEPIEEGKGRKDEWVLATSLQFGKCWECTDRRKKLL
jgi:hypothetical protein